MTISLIVATDKNNCIGFNDSLPFKEKSDMKRFVSLTQGLVVVMGRKTADSLNKPLKNRLNVVLTRSHYSRQGFFCTQHIDYIVRLFNDIVIIGGSEIYKNYYDLADIIHLSVVNTDLNITDKENVKYLDINLENFMLVETSNHTTDEDNRYGHKYYRYKKR